VGAALQVTPVLVARAGAMRNDDVLTVRHSLLVQSIPMQSGASAVELRT
jgi:hypothetical protein